jgi:hypothetical protein
MSHVPFDLLAGPAKLETGGTGAIDGVGFSPPFFSLMLAPALHIHAAISPFAAILSASLPSLLLLPIADRRSTSKLQLGRWASRSLSGFWCGDMGEPTPRGLLALGGGTGAEGWHMRWATASARRVSTGEFSLPRTSASMRIVLSR